MDIDLSSINTYKLSNDDIKRLTLEIYDSMPQEKEKRKNCFQERDAIITLNYKFFGYVASRTFINNSSVTYEDKLQSALMHFCECFWWYKWKGDETHKGYRSDLSFSVFYLPRIGEMIERELNEVKYSIRRTLCMKVGNQLGKHWGKVTYADLSDPRIKLSASEMNSLKAIFGTLYIADIADHETYIAADPTTALSIDTQLTEKYDSVEELLIHDMIILEEKLTDKELKHMSDMYQIDIKVLKDALPRAEAILLKRIRASQYAQDVFSE